MRTRCFGWLRSRPLAQLLLIGLLGAFVPGGEARAQDAVYPAIGSPQCRIGGIAYYSTRQVREASCSASGYTRVCAEAENAHREVCQDFCSAFKALDDRTQCAGFSKPMAVLFDAKQHCNETRRNAFEVTCVVMGDCWCTP